MNIRDILQAFADAVGLEDASEQQPKMMPPQTQELELAKKAAGVPSEFDNVEPEQPEVEVSDCGCGGAPEQDAELEYMRKLAGITQNKE
jgi:hypothetical protein